MAGESVAKLPLGQKIPAAAEFDSRQLGIKTWFPDLDYTVAGVKPHLTSMQVEAVLCRLSNSTPIAPGTNIKFKVAGTEVDVVTAGGDVAHGQVDPYLNANVVQGDVFWVIVSGPTIQTAGGAISANASIRTGASGRAVSNDYSTATHTAYGIAIAAAAGAASKFRALVDFARR